MTLRQNTKHHFCNFLIDVTKTCESTPPNEARWIIDTMSVITAIRVKETYKGRLKTDIKFTLPSSILKPLAVYVDDMYQGISAKNCSRDERRQSGTRVHLQSLQQKMLSNKEWLAFFHHIKNKQHLLSLFVTYLYVLKKCLNRKEKIRLLNTIGVPCKDTTVKYVEKFIQTVCFSREDEGSFTENKLRLYKQMKLKTSQSLPTNERSMLQAIKRVHYQVYYWPRVNETIISDILLQDNGWIGNNDNEEVLPLRFTDTFLISFLHFQSKPKNLIPLPLRINLKRSYFPGFIPKKTVIKLKPGLITKT